MKQISEKIPGGRIRKARMDSGMTLNELAATIDMNSNHLSMVERGEKKPSPRLLEKVAAVTGVSLDWLRNGDGISPESHTVCPLLSTTIHTQCMQDKCALWNNEQNACAILVLSINSTKAFAQNAKTLTAHTVKDAVNTDDQPNTDIKPGIRVLLGTRESESEEYRYTIVTIEEITSETLRIKPYTLDGTEEPQQLWNKDYERLWKIEKKNI